MVVKGVEMYKGLIFDFDYTLGDSTKGIVKCVNYALRRLGMNEKSDEEIRKTIGLTLIETYKVLSGRDDNEEAEQFRKYFICKADEVMVADTELYSNVKNIMTELRNSGYKLGIVTTKFRYRIEGILGKFDADNMVDLIVGGDDVKVEKPNPEGLIYAIETLGLEGSQILYVGDSIVDAKTACNAGVDFAAVLTGTTTREEFEHFPHVFIGQDIMDIYGLFK